MPVNVSQFAQRMSISHPPAGRDWPKERASSLQKSVLQLLIFYVRHIKHTSVLLAKIHTHTHTPHNIPLAQPSTWYRMTVYRKKKTKNLKCHVLHTGLNLQLMGGFSPLHPRINFFVSIPHKRPAAYWHLTELLARRENPTQIFASNSSASKDLRSLLRSGKCL